MKLWAMLYRATQIRQVMVQSSDNIEAFLHWRKEWETTSVFRPREPHAQYEKAKDVTLKDALPRSVGAQYAWRSVEK